MRHPYALVAALLIAAVLSAIRAGFGVTIGTAFRPWGWGGNRFGWTNHTVIVNNRGWDRR